MEVEGCGFESHTRAVNMSLEKELSRESCFAFSIKSLICHVRFFCILPSLTLGVQICMYLRNALKSEYACCYVHVYTCSYFHCPLLFIIIICCMCPFAHTDYGERE